jgi:hypothetical protein
MMQLYKTCIDFFLVQWIEYFWEPCVIGFFSCAIKINTSSCFTFMLATPKLKRLVTGFPPWRPGFAPGAGQVGFVVDKVALGQVFSEYFGFPCQSLFHQILHNHNHPGQVQ